MISLDNAATMLDRISDDPVAYDVEFQKDSTVFETHIFERANEAGVHLYIDVDKDNVPIAITFVHQPENRGYRKVDGDSEEFKHAIANLFAFASQLAAFAKLQPPPHVRVRKSMGTSAKFPNMVEDEGEMSKVFNKAAKSMKEMELFAMAGT